MKKSNMTVSMPMTTYMQIESLLNDYENLKEELKSCIHECSNDYYLSVEEVLMIIKKIKFTYPSQVNVEIQLR